MLSTENVWVKRLDSTEMEKMEPYRHLTIEEWLGQRE